MKEIVELLKEEITYFKKLKSALGEIHGHIHSLAVGVAQTHLASKHTKVRSWKISAKYGKGIDIVGRDTKGKTVVAAEVKTTARSEKKSLGSQQRTKVREDLEKLLAVNAKYKYFFIIDNKNRKSIETIMKNLDRSNSIDLINVFEC